MIFDITLINEDGLTSEHYRPRSKATCTGLLQYKGITIASLKTVAMCYTKESALAGGRFELEWFRQDLDINFLEDFLDIYIEYGEGKPTIIKKKWYIKSIAIVPEGVPLGISSLTDLMLGEYPFFSLNFKEEIIDEQFIYAAA